MNLEEVGNPAGPPLLLIHGFMSCNAQWDANVGALGEHLRLVLLEQMGHGRSQAPQDVREYSPERVLARIDATREALGIESWWIGGHSLGGAIALHYALAHPEHVRGVVFTNTRAAFGLPRGSDDADNRPATHGIGSLRDLAQHPWRATRLPADAQARMVAAADAMPWHAVDHVASYTHDWKSADELHRLTMPVLLVNGRWEKAFQPSIEHARSTIRDLTLIELEGGHAINLEQPDAFNKAVLAFISTRST